jgi:TRAP-type C4-dicarboxylate transport system permease small subunit
VINLLDKEKEKWLALMVYGIVILVGVLFMVLSVTLWIRTSVWYYQLLSIGLVLLSIFYIVMGIIVRREWKKTENDEEEIE